ncbi:hypothetical protein SUGI_1382800 [Cryptomeria japonica]|uniref:non-specific serine/threonine protein kinase n=1 Tax=Cryptomeria japonica TaxID=3369 RepID=A0AAD3NS89_CRYJA|nr:hypothetical protein SUGI_1382800 [Cryptomeria japonica]
MAYVIAGFLSIDCGAKTNHIDERNIKWVTDDNYIDLGQKVVIEDSSLPAYQQSLRVFPHPLNKSCYQLPITPNVPYLFRIRFYKGNYSGVPELPIFKYSIETTDMLSVANIIFQTPQENKTGERIFITSAKMLYICLIRTSELHNPFISAMELRTLRQGMYHQVKPGTMLRMEARYDAGGKSIIRYPQDQFDRLWFPFPVQGLQDITLQETISTNNTQNLPPSAVMHTALAAPANQNTITLNFSILKNPLLLLYFAEIEILNVSESRNFLVLENNAFTLANISLERNYSAIEVGFTFVERPLFTVALYSPSNFSTGPLINAFEYYGLLFSEPQTSTWDVAALAAVKEHFEIKEWVADPCFGLPWEGINCSNSTTAVRVLAIDLSGKNLTGSIPTSIAQMTELINISFANNNLSGAFPNFSNLSRLERLHLQNNNLNGEIPDWLSQLPNLKELFIENNNFSGVLPQHLLDKSSLKLKYNGNAFLCMNKQDCVPSMISTRSNSKPKRIKVGIVMVLIASGIVVIALLLLVNLIVYRKIFRKKAITNANVKSRASERKSLYPNSEGWVFIRDFHYSIITVPNPSKTRAFTREEMMTATENFSYKIGRGGFGSVFWGKLPDGKQIAVKVLSLYSKQGAVEFLNEIDLLSRVNHRNLLHLLGYCNKCKELMLVYEYMVGGSLMDHLYGPHLGKYSNLDWKSRLQIALDAAQGLEYLHVDCTPKIIHRDIKTANILLDDNLNGKLADFGLSRLTIDGEASHVATTVKGTVGYLDPEYFHTQMLTEKSDVYSFGVLLLEMICGRPAIDTSLSDQEMSLIRWVKPLFEIEDHLNIAEIVDKGLGDDYSIKSVVHVGKLAIRCVESKPSSRPSVSRVVIELKEAVEYNAVSVDLSEEIDIDYGDHTSLSSPLDCTGSRPSF